MHLPKPRWQQVRAVLIRGLVAMAFLSICTLAAEPQAKVDVLRIGTSGTLTTEGGGRNEKSSLDTLRTFVKEETGLETEIIKQHDWRELTDKLSKGELQIGVFPGFEYAWAREKHADLKPLAVAVNINVYPVVCVVTGRDNRANDFAGLDGQSRVKVSGGPSYIELYIDRQCKSAGKSPQAFFSKITAQDNFEDILDDVVDGNANAAMADRAALDAYKRRKPARFNKLKAIAESPPFPPAVVAYYGTALDEATLNQFRQGLLNASTREKGQTMLTLFRLTGFEASPADFDKVLAATLKAYPPDKAGSDPSKDAKAR